MVKKSKVIKRTPLDDAQKYQILKQYAEGVPVEQIARSVSRDTNDITKFIQYQLRGMNTIRETNDLIVTKNNPKLLKNQQGPTPTKFITPSFLSAIETQGSVYAYYFAQTQDNKFALEQSGLHTGLPAKLKQSTKDYVYRIRGQFLRDIPEIKQYLKDDMDRKIKEYNIEKPQVQMELMNQIDQLKELAVNDTRQRSNLLKAIEMLGRSIGAFTDRVEVEETDARSGLEILMQKAKDEVYERKED